MLKFDYGKQSYEVRFKHLPNDSGTLLHERRRRGTVRTEFTLYLGKTNCYILDSEGKEVSVGEAFCSLQDIYNKAVGRKISLTRALSAFDDKNFRRFVWQKYFDKLYFDKLSEHPHYNSE